MVILNKHNLVINLLSTCLFFQIWDWKSCRNLGNLKALLEFCLSCITVKVTIATDYFYYSHYLIFLPNFKTC